ncbi:MAG TPA: sugar transferase [Candidatus Saccharimonadales bacterium]|nr:sugar transferase [Candidatus Saccharimonadales bacterium]
MGSFASSGEVRPNSLVARRWTIRLELFAKRSFDILFSLLALVLISPALLLIAILVKLDSTGPILYVSERIGRNGKQFRFFKFRTMVKDADSLRGALQHLNERRGSLFKMSNDPRVTRLGKLLRRYSLDELPQFFSVLSGDMSVIGPRPCLTSEYAHYTKEQRRRADVVPGITGLWQVQARTDPSAETYFAMDTFYAENWSLWLDFKILLKTVGVVFSGTGQ